jgi:EpsI family protein
MNVARSTIAGSSGARALGRQALVVLLAAAAVAAYWPTVAALFERWLQRGPYDHGLIVLAGAAWLAARRPVSGRKLAGGAGILAIAAVAGLAIAWSLAWLANVTIAAEACLLAIAGGVVLACGGPAAVRGLAWPLILLMLAVPVWDLAIPVLQSIAVFGASAGVAAAGVPAVISGNTIEISSGTFEIAEGCSGLRYFLSAATLAILAGEVTALGDKARWLLVGIAACAAALGNWVRILIIILVGDASAMQHPLVEDHLWLGWVTFAAIVLPAVLVSAMRLRGPRAPDQVRAAWPRWPRATLPRATALMTALLAAPLGAQWLEAVRYRGAVPALEWPPAATGWLGPAEAACPWQPEFPGVAARQCVVYESREGRPVIVAVAAYLRQAPGRELIGGEGSRPQGRWRALDRSPVMTSALEPDAVMGHTMAPVGGAPWRMWYWYQIGPTVTSDPLRMQLAEALALPPAPPAALIAIAAPCLGDCRDADSTLERYLASHPGATAIVRRSTLDPVDAT